MKNKPSTACSAVVLYLASAIGGAFAFGQTEKYDIVIYGGTSGGITAAVQAARMGKSVALIEPTGRVGGMTTNGLSFTDTGFTEAIHGLAREFYAKVGQAYGKSGPEWRFEPKVALDMFDEWLQAPGITVFKNERLDLSDGVGKRRNVIQSIRMESGKVFTGRMFIDAGYEGDLMAKAGVSYTVGRESNDAYGEQFNGVVLSGGGSSNHNFAAKVDPYTVAGSPDSSLLPGIDPAGPGVAGSGDHRVQSYNFRLTLTRAADRRAWTPPDGYDASRYELLLRHVRANNINQVAGKLLKIDAIQGGKYDFNNQGAVSTDFIGQNYAYPDADYQTREEIITAHRRWQQGLLYFLASDPRLPQSIRNEMNSYGLTRDEFLENEGWSDQIYVREARRMIGQYVMTDRDVLGHRTVDDPIGLASYTMDSHHTRRYVTRAGAVRNEGNVEVGLRKPFRISYRSVTPLESEASNLLVISALSSSHIAYGSIRMEPVFMILGQSAATAAAIAIDNEVSVQQVPYRELRSRLIADGQALEEPATDVLRPRRPKGVVVDDAEAEKVGS